MKYSPFTPRIVAVLLTLALSLSSPAFALRQTGLEESHEERQKLAQALRGQPGRNQAPVAARGIFPRGQISPAAGAEEKQGSDELKVKGKELRGDGEGKMLSGRDALAVGPSSHPAERSDPELSQSSLPHREPINPLPSAIPPLALNAYRQDNQYDVETQPNGKGFDSEPLSNDAAQDETSQHRVASVNGDLQQSISLLGSERRHETRLALSIPYSLTPINSTAASGAEEPAQAIKGAVLKSAHTLVKVGKDSAFLSDLRDEDGELARDARISLGANRRILEKSDEVLGELLRGNFASSGEALAAVKAVELPQDLEDYRPQIDAHFQEVIDDAFSAGAEEGRVAQEQVRGFLGALGKEAPEGVTPIFFSPTVREMYPVVNALSGLEEQNIFLLGGARELSGLLSDLIIQRDVRGIVYAGLEGEIEAARPITQLAGVELQGVSPGQGRDFLGLMVAALAKATGLEEAAIQAREGFQEFQAGLEQLAAIGV